MARTASDNPRDERVHVWVTSIEHKHILEHVGPEGSVSTWARRVILEHIAGTAQAGTSLPTNEE